ncbi:UDP-GlcNAc:betaGal beta-1,3-N-acetylglucosaminyltransferase 7, like [Stegostoma tigrinum]|uniref:UDP-GlcNAc:betaGal beta-1,3-N-acetylglucosaminyltransferase 7, like n=1 Tax=Stegostoma tigrinum TaxID=3053191 RepID=UPI00202AD67B|nr:UDP-GlcNAc:betaGal beta-1,3-N-acetylglucosaminyltransferase 7, like [Stegostoma tigrinum]
MDYIFRKRKLLKTLLSLSLFFAVLALLQKLKLGDGLSPNAGLRVEASAGGGERGGGRRQLEVAVGGWLEAENIIYRSGANSNGSNGGAAAAPAPGSEEAQMGPAAGSANLSSPAWDITVTECSPNASVRSLPWFSGLDSRFQQYVLYRHCRYFPLLLNHPEKCRPSSGGKRESGSPHLLIAVKSVIEQHDRRAAVRKTWGRELTMGGRSIRTVFLLGTPAAGKDRRNLQKLLEYEDRLYGDILQWDFMDTFFNLTLKEVNFLKWFDIYCRGTRFIFKGDDDVFVNTENLLEFLASQSEGPRRENLFAGDIISRALPIRNHQSKYFIPKQLHDRPYPPYAGGGGFLMASALARRLLNASEGIELYPIDDVYLGMCLQKVGVEPQLHYAFRTFGIVKRRVSPMNSDPCFYKNLVVIHKLSPEGLLQMWDTVHNSTLVCAKKFSVNLDE